MKYLAKFGHYPTSHPNTTEIPTVEVLRFVRSKRVLSLRQRRSKAIGMMFEQFAAAHGLMLRHVEFGKWVRVPNDRSSWQRRMDAYRHLGDMPLSRITRPWMLRSHGFGRR